MKHRFTKLLSLALALGTAVTLFAGCGENGTGSNGSDNTAPAENSQETGSETAAETKEPRPSADFLWTMEANDNADFPGVEINDNPAIDYWSRQTYTVDGDEDVSVNITFQVPPEIDDAWTNMFATGEYTDVMNMVMVPMSAAELYERGICLDLTDYVEEYMPNYRAWMDAHPDIKKQLYLPIDGKDRILQLFRVDDAPMAPWCGFCYRRDWIVKYGKDADGNAFTGGWNEDKTEWTDNVVFPSGNTDPIYLSDWEWMLDIFATALKDLGIEEEGYPMQMNYLGYYEYGDLVSTFNGGPQFYLNSDGEYVFGGDDDAFRLYVEVMADWYAKGWIDPGFDEEVNPAFFMLDTAVLYSGKCGLWYGMTSQLGHAFDFGVGDPITTDICVYGAPNPLNDLYGDASNQNVEPFLNGSTGLPVNDGCIITDKAADKDLPALLTAIDWLYGPEGSLVAFRGLNAEQQTEIQNKFMTDNNLEYCYTTEERDGVTTYVINPAIYENGLENAIRAQRLPGLLRNANLDLSKGQVETHANDVWTMYENTGKILLTVESQLSLADVQEASIMKSNLTTFMSQEVPNFIAGRTDIHDDAAWQAYVDGIANFDPDSYCEKINDILK